ncbi:23372_t:CDS:2 [Dentiscutata erythropus]|uniref:Chitin synthase n=1 Tax=Dentiscutata erythropus TaxID=1348616 RepID=A0A9N9FAK7_9GLOM|nr:23372_t:CDS:2 [Dentiscutata erythropus]
MQYSEQLLSFFEDNNIKIFDYSQHKNRKFIGKGGFAIVYSAIFDGIKYALKSFNNNLSLNDKEFQQFSRERPKLNEILIELENLSTETVEFITNPINNQQMQQLNFYSYNAGSALSINTYDSNELESNPKDENNDANNITIYVDPKEPSEQEYYKQERDELLEPSGQTPYRLKSVELLNGNLVLECPVSENILKNIPHNSREFTHLRYTACTSKPETFRENNFILRQIEYKRETELFIMINMCDDNEILLSYTLDGIMENIAYLCSLRDSPTWGNDGWEKVVVCIISDDRNHINEQVLAYLTVLGVYQDNIEKSKVNNKFVEAHIYEYTTLISIKHFKNSVEIKSDEGVVPIQILFCLIEQSKKDDPSQWFFNAFCPVLVFKVCVLVDVGIKPGYRSLYALWNAVSTDSDIVGVCGNIDIIKGESKIKLLNPIAGAQNFYYKMLYSLDKPFESIFGYINSLSEGFSAYKYEALQSCANNLCLSNEHALNFDLVTSKDHHWKLHYVKSAHAETNIPENLPELIHQQKCHINKYFLASLYAITHFYCIWKSGHTIFHKICLQIKIIYQACDFLFSWFASGIFSSISYLFFIINAINPFFVVVTSEDKPSYSFGYCGVMAAFIIYGTLIFVQIIFAIINKPQR